MKNKLWKGATFLVVIFLILNPEMAELSVFINAVGIDIFIMLLQVQVLAIVGIFLNTKIKPHYRNVKEQITNNFLKYLFVNIKNESKILLLIVPSPVIVMNMLVLTALLGILINA